MNSTNHRTTDPPKLGLLAAWGRYPIVVAQALERQRFDVFCIGIKDHADPVLREICADFYPCGLGKIGAAIRYFRRNGVRRATMAGKVHKVQMFQPYAWIHHFPDWRCLRTFYPHFITGTKDRKDDTLLGAMVTAYAEDDIAFFPATNLVPELLVKHGQLSGRRLTAAQRQDIQFAWQIAKELGRLDVGQTVAVKGRAVLALEAVEGTDECIRRAGGLCPAGSFTVVKVAKPQQDMRFDVPTVGLGTLKTMAESGGRVLAVEADKTILIDEPDAINFATRHNITVVAM